MMPHSLRNVLVLVFGLILIAVVVSWGIYYVLQKQTGMGASNAETIIPSPTTALSDTTSWETYTNNFFLFSIKYPKNELKSFVVEDQSKDTLQVHGTPLDPKDKRSFPPFSIYIAVNNYKPSLDTYTNTQLNDRAYANAKKSSITLNGLPAYAISRIPSDTSAITRIFSYEVYVKKDPYIYDLSISSADEESLTSNRGLFNSMLSTLTLLNASPSSVKK